jgi:hypothetical protein
MHGDLRMHTIGALTILRASDRMARVSSSNYIATADVNPVQDFLSMHSST